MSALVSETRWMALPTSMMVERPTSNLTADVSSPAYTARGEATAINRMKTNLRISLLLSHDFLCALLSADDLDRRRRRFNDNGNGGDRRHRSRAGARHGVLGGRAESEQRRRADAMRHRHRLVERVAQRELNLAFRARQRQPLGFFRVDQERDDAHRHPLVLFRIP